MVRGVAVLLLSLLSLVHADPNVDLSAPLIVTVPDPGNNDESINNNNPNYNGCFQIDPTLPMQAYMNPDIIQNEHTMEQIRLHLQQKHLVVLKDAFLPEFAEAMYQTLENATTKELWQLETHTHDDGFHYHHHNIYDQDLWDPLLLQARDMFYNDATKEFMRGMSQRDTSADPDCSPSYYMPGDFSMPHEDHFGQRTVGFVWHLSKDWKPEYGGGLVWLPERRGFKMAHASFNTLFLFDINSKSDHLVTTVRYDAPGRRYAFNGWWGATWEPETWEDPQIDVSLGSRRERALLTATQSDAIMRILYEEVSEEDQETERYQHLMKLWETYELEHRSPYTDTIAFIE